MPSIQFVFLTHSPSDTSLLFQGLNLRIERSKTGLMGSNGSGKSSLLRLAAGEQKAVRGEVITSHKPFYIPQLIGAADWPEALGASLWQQVRPWWRLEAGGTDPELFVELEPHWGWMAGWGEVSERWKTCPQPWARTPQSFSGGEMQRLRLALAELMSHEILLPDEPSLHLDQEGRERLLESVRSFHGLLWVASHDRELMEEMDSILYLDPRGARLFPCAYSQMRAIQTQEQAALMEQHEQAISRLQAEKRLAQRMREKQQKKGDRAHKSREQAGLPKILLGRRQRQAETTAGKLKSGQDQRIDQLQAEKRDIESRLPQEVPLNFDLRSGQKSASWLVRANACLLKLDDRPLWKHPLHLSSAQGEKLWLQGPNGSGKSTLLRAIAYRLPIATLQVQAKNVLLLDQDLQHLEACESLVSLWKNTAYLADESLRRTVAARLGLGSDKLNQKFGLMSGGERMRAALVLMSTQIEPPDLILLDEPSNHLDLATQEALLRTLSLYPSGIILVSHEKGFAETLAFDDILDLGPLLED